MRSGARGSSGTRARGERAESGRAEPGQVPALLPPPHDLALQPHPPGGLPQGVRIDKQVGKRRSPVPPPAELDLHLPGIAPVSGVGAPEIRRVQEDLAVGPDKGRQAGEKVREPRKRPGKPGSVHERHHGVEGSTGVHSPQVAHDDVGDAPLPQHDTGGGEQLQRRDREPPGEEWKGEGARSGAHVQHPSAAQGQGRRLQGLQLRRGPEEPRHRDPLLSPRVPADREGARAPTPVVVQEGVAQGLQRLRGHHPAVGAGAPSRTRAAGGVAHVRGRPPGLTPAASPP